MQKGWLAHLAVSGGKITVRVTPNARQNAVTEMDGCIKVSVTSTPANGMATRQVQKILARAIGVAPSRLELIRGATSRDKVFRLD